MTAPTLARQSGSYGERTYAWPPTPPFEFEVASVTNSIGNGFPKPFLVPWAAKVAAECAVDDHAIISAMLDKGQEKAAIDHIKNARSRTMGDKADRGTIVHSALEAYIDGVELDAQTLGDQLKEARVPKNLWKATHGMITGVLQFLEDEKPTIYHSEQTVFNRTYRYAGTADLIARAGIEKKVTAKGKKFPVVIDVKTSKSIYDDTAMQLCAYARGEFVGMNDGREVKLTPKGEAITHGIIIRPMASGTYERAVFDLNDDVFDLFLNCQAIAQGKTVLKRSRRP